MSTRRTAALAVGAAILLGGGATALAATTDQSARPIAQTAAPSGESHSIDTAAVIDATAAIDAGSGSTEAIAPTEVDGSGGTTAPAPSAAAAGADARAEDAGDAEAGRVAGPDALFHTMPTVPSDWTWPDDTSELPDDGPGLPFNISGMGLDTLISLARSVGIEVGTPVLGDDGSITVEVTLPDGTVHTVWAAFDADHRITDATVDGTPIAEFVQQFLSGEIGRQRPPVDPHPEWNLPD